MSEDKQDTKPSSERGDVAKKASEQPLQKRLPIVLALVPLVVGLMALGGGEDTSLDVERLESARHIDAGDPRLGVFRRDPAKVAVVVEELKEGAGAPPQVEIQEVDVALPAPADQVAPAVEQVAPQAAPQDAPEAAPTPETTPADP